jgi:hypothetical protein
MLKYIIITIYLLLCSGLTYSQYILTEEELKDPDRVKNAQLVRGAVIDGDTVLYVFMNEIVIMPPREFKTEKEKIYYTKLMYNIKKVYPYALIINQTYKEIEENVVNIDSERDRKAYLKTKEQELRDQFEDEIVNLTYTQGRLLIKLVDRETGSTTFEVLKEFKGSISAFFWQSVAVMFGANLKSEYDAIEEDKMIEEIINMIENGQI